MDPLFEFALLIKAGQREFERRANETMKPLGLTAGQADAISVIGQAGPLSLKELGELLIAEAGHPSRLVDRLVEADLVERRSADDDRRRIVLSLTAKGRRTEKRVVAARQQALEAGKALIGDRDIESVLAILRDLAQFSPYAGLIARRRELFDQHLVRARTDRPAG
jgi:DNA-binding MarR family transcriptional regulator